MPAALPEATLAQNLANPSAGRPVLFDALSGPKGSPFDNDKQYAADLSTTSSGKASTGAMCTGIGYGLNVFIGQKPFSTPAQAIDNAGFNDDSGEAAGYNSTIIYIGGGRSVVSAGKNPAGQAGVNPYTTGFAPCGAGNGGSRDGGTGPAYTGFAHKMVTATATVANGAVVETGYVNRTGQSMAATDSTFGSASAAQAAPA